MSTEAGDRQKDLATKLDGITVLVRAQSELASLPPMNAALSPEVLLGAQPTDQPALPMTADGVQRYVWQSAFGPMLIEVREGAAFVNGSRVTPIHELRAERPPA
jgi:hypothetical protein